MTRTTGRLGTIACLASLVAAGVVQAAPSPGAGAATARRGAGTVHIEKVSVGKVLVTSSGRTLYVFGPDARKTPTCAGSCAGVWPPLLASHKPIAGPGVKKSMLGTVRTKSGRLQVTYDHWPLYTFSGDTAAGQTHGQGVVSYGGTWSAIAATGKTLASVTSAAGHSRTSATSGGGSGGGW